MSSQKMLLRFWHFGANKGLICDAISDGILELKLRLAPQICGSDLLKRKFNTKQNNSKYFILSINDDISLDAL